MNIVKRAGSGVLLFLPTMLALLLPIDLLACVPQGDPRLSLTVEPTEIAGSNRILTVTLYTDGCIVVQLPAHYKRAGNYSLMATPIELTQLESAQQSQAVRGFDNRQLARDLAQFHEQRAGQVETEMFEVADADRYTLRVQDGGTESIARVDAVFQYAEKYPELTGLREFKQAVALLLGFSRSEDLQPLSEGVVPPLEAQP